MMPIMGMELWRKAMEVQNMAIWGFELVLGSWRGVAGARTEQMCIVYGSVEGVDTPCWRGGDEVFFRCSRRVGFFSYESEDFGISVAVLGSL